MRFTVSALGGELGHPLDLPVIGALEDAVTQAHRLLERHPECECVEIFAEGRFVGDIERGWA